jgi:hypothetical protein
MAYAFKKIRAVTMPVLKIKKGVEYFLKLTTPMALGKEIKGSNMGPATVCQAVNLETAELGQVICPYVLVKELHEAYPGDAYVGKCFSLVLTPVPGKRYNAVQLSEVGDPTGEQEWRDNAEIERQRRQAEGIASNTLHDLGGEGEETDPDTGEISPPARAPAPSKPAAKPAAGKRRR